MAVDIQTAQEPLALMERSLGDVTVELFYMGPNLPLVVSVKTAEETFTIIPDHQNCIMDCYNHPFSQFWYDQRIAA